MAPTIARKSRRLRKALGQHFMTHAATLEYEAAMARVKGKKILEIGGGTGNLTEVLANEAKRIAVIEKDTALVSLLKSKFAGKRNIDIVEGDFLSMDPDEFKVEVIVGNIPYSISSLILFKLRDWEFDHALICVQKEFAERMVAAAGTKDYSRLSVMTQLYFKPIFLKLVPRGYFAPMPEVDSAIVYLTKTETKLDIKRDKFIEHLFSHGKNTLHAALKAREMKELYPDATEAAQKLGLERRRVFSLRIDELLSLFSEMV